MDRGTVRRRKGAQVVPLYVYNAVPLPSGSPAPDAAGEPLQEAMRNETS